MDDTSIRHLRINDGKHQVEYCYSDDYTYESIFQCCVMCEFVIQ